MKFEETVASRCRWSSYVPDAVSDAEILWEHSTADWQGSAKLLGRTTDGRYVLGSWSYGSCSGCDGWMSEPEETVIEEMADQFDYLPGKAALKVYLEMLVKENADNKYDYNDTKGQIAAIQKELGLVAEA